MYVADDAYSHAFSKGTNVTASPPMRQKHI